MIAAGLSVFQLFLIVLFGGLFVGSLVAFLRGRTTRAEGILRLIVFGVATIAAIRPKLTTDAAELLGIGRGADLLLYITVLVMLMGFWMTYVRLRRLRRQLTLLVRATALEQATGLVDLARLESASNPDNDTNAADRSNPESPDPA